MIRQEPVEHDRKVHCKDKSKEFHRETSDFFILSILLIAVFFCCVTLNADHDKGKQSEQNNKNTCV